MTKIMILGGYGNFGKRIAVALAKKHLPLIIAGRHAAKAEALLASLPAQSAEVAIFDMNIELAAQLQRWQPAVVINTCGPFQGSSYDAARSCICHGVHYIDLADGRDYVTGITALDAEAKLHNVAVISGASTVPGLSSAVLEHFRPEFSDLAFLRFGISPGQKTERGLATTQAVMSYVGKPLKAFAGSTGPAFGWQDIYRQPYPELGHRWMANCDIPDLDLLPARYGIRNIRFSAGLELGLMHLGLWGLSWAVRLGLPFNLAKHAGSLLKISDMLNPFGSADGGMHMIMRGTNKAGQPHERRWFIIAKNGDGPQIPTVPAILLAEKLATGKCAFRGAAPCVGMLTLEEYLQALQGFAITTRSERG